MNDERLGEEIGAFYRETDVTPPDPRESARQVAARLGQTPQVKRRRWAPSWRARRPAELRPDRTPATHDHQPTVIGRTHTMFSPAKAITAGALVFALGGVLLIAQPLGQLGSAPEAPGDAADPGPAAYVNGTFDLPGSCCGDEVETYDEDGNRSTLRGLVMSGTVRMDDPRLSGDYEWTTSLDEFPQQGTDERVEVHWGALAITNDEGGWSGTWKSAYDASQFPEEVSFGSFELTGTGAYEGLSALLSQPVRGTTAGIIFPGPLPPDSAYDR